MRSKLVASTIPQTFYEIQAILQTMEEGQGFAQVGEMLHSGEK